MSGELLVLVRHGITDWNHEGRFQGHLDPPLGEDGRREAALVAERLATDPALRPGRVISSTLGRGLETAGPIAASAGVEVVGDARLIEIGQGRWLTDANVIETLAGLGAAPVAEDQATPEAHTQRLQEQIELWRPIIEAASAE